MTTDKTGAETTVSAADGKYTIAVDGQTGSADADWPPSWSQTLSRRPARTESA
jgi:hypothetical protein